VFFLRDSTFFQVSSPFTNIFCLWERTDCSGRKSWKVEFSLLSFFTSIESRSTFSIFISDVANAVFNLRSVDQWRCTAAFSSFFVCFETFLGFSIHFTFSQYS